MVIGIIGGGASGMAAAIAASGAPNVQVVLLERQARLGRKLRATGNGRCNLSNLHAGQGGYHGEEPDFWRYALEQHDSAETLAWFRTLGLYTVTEPSGRVYPYSDQANSVADVLRFALDRPNILIKPGFEVQSVHRAANGFTVRGSEESVTCDRLIVACGGLAGTTLGGSLSGYKILKSLGHSATPLRPSLVQLRADWTALPSLKGVRANCAVTVLRDGKPFSAGTGELQFTQYGLSGPVIFELSRDVCCGAGDWRCRMDFLPALSRQELAEYLSERADFPTQELFTGLLHNRLGRVLTQQAGISLSGFVRELPPAALTRAAETAKALTVHLTQPMGMDAAQVTAGGIRTAEFDAHTLESRLVPGLYACGEVLDVDGACGGYNLQWAWSSGRLAGESAGGINNA